MPDRQPEPSWPDEIPLHRPAPDLPLEACDPLVGPVNPVDLEFNPAYKIYVSPDVHAQVVADRDAAQRTLHAIRRLVERPVPAHRRADVLEAVNLHAYKWETS